VTTNKPASSIVVLGSTGSIGISTLSVISRHRQRFRAFALAAHSDVDTLFAQCLEFRPRYAVLANADAATELTTRIREAGVDYCEVLAGPQSLEFVAAHPDADAVMAAIVGAAGLPSTLAAAKAGKKIMLANKESMVMAGPLLIDTARNNGAVLLPIDSEHNAIFQALPASYTGDMEASGVRRLVLTASGGPFLRSPPATLSNVTPDQACAHPNWVMGRKISVDSATLMNKGLEVIEAHYLFGAQPEQIDVVVHPQSVVHSLVEYFDGSVIAQLGNPDMRTPIAHALAYPERITAGVESLDLLATAKLEFEAPDMARFPCLRLAYDSLRAGGSMPVYLNAANEVAVENFLNNKLSFNAIASVVELVLQRLAPAPVDTIEQIVAADHMAREAAQLISTEFVQSAPLVTAGQVAREVAGGKVAGGTA
jgi:1-deoxy-D-xylulose-5-phosphate reductoisomerase